jgi:hypothetical protein
MTEKLIVSDIKLVTKGGFNELSANVDGDHVYFRVADNFELSLSAECFVGIALLEAMISNRILTVEGVPISKKLHGVLNEIQAVYRCWNSSLSIVEIQADTISDQHYYQKTGSFFSAGVDSTHTLLTHLEDITHLILFRAFDSGNDQASWDKRVEKQTKFAESIGKTLVPVETNAKDWAIGRKISSHFFHGLLLSSAGGALGMHRIYIPASHTYDELFPWGSHPLSDPMWSTESTEIIHADAGARRGKKMAVILQNPVFADNLQVCWASTVRNCGKCPKCVRTMVAVYLLGGTINSLPPFTDFSTLKMLKAHDESGATFLEDAMLLARQSNNTKIYKILYRYHRQFKLSQTFVLVDKYLMGSLFRRLYRRVKNPDWINWRVTMQNKNSD